MGYCDREGAVFTLDEMIGKFKDLLQMEVVTIVDEIAIFLGVNRDSALFKDLVQKLVEFHITSGMEEGKVLVS